MKLPGGEKRPLIIKVSFTTRMSMKKTTKTRPLSSACGGGNKRTGKHVYTHKMGYGDCPNTTTSTVINDDATT